MKIFICFVLLCFAGIAFTNAQPVNTRISGKIISAANAVPIEGAVVKLRQQKRPVISKSDGTFTILLTSEKDSLEISHVSFRPFTLAVTSSGNTNLVVRLEESVTQMENVEVSTGYQIIPKDRATGSFVRVSPDLMNRRVAPGIISRLEGITSGLVFFKGTPNRPDEINIRGQSTLFSNSQPLVVIDNFPYEGDISSINPNDVENITVLKDAAAASIWGVRAGNGVIVITTKKGRFNRPLEVSMNSNVSFGREPDIYYDSRFINSADFVEMEKFLFEKGLYNADFNAFDKRPLSNVVDILHKEQSGLISVQEANNSIDALKQNDIRADLQKYFYRSPVNQQYSLSFKGGSDKANYLFSAGFDKSLSSIVGNNNHRVTLHSFSVFRPLTWMEISAGIDYIPSYSESNNINSQILLGGSRGRGRLPYTQLADDQGNAVPIIKDYKPSFVKDAPANGFLNWQYYPLSELRNGDNTSKTHSTATRISNNIKIEITNDISTSVTFQYEKGLRNNRRLATENSYYVRNLVNMYSEVSPTGKFLNYVLPPGGILDIFANDLTSVNLRGQLNFNREWNKHSLVGLAGAEVRQIRTKSNSNRVNGYNDELATYALIDETAYYTTYPAGRMFPLPNSLDVGGTLDRFRSYFTTASYSYNQRYILSASARIDGSNYFGATANKRYVPLWSAGFMWNVSDEKFYKMNWLPDLKARITYGFNGNLNKQITAYTTGIYQGADGYTNQPYLNVTNPPNKNLQWEKSAMLNVGVDFASVKNRIAGTIEYFFRKGTDIIGDNQIPPSTGFIDLNAFTNTVKGNYANMKSHGWDVQLYSKNIDRQFKWSTQLLFSFATDKVTHYGGTVVPSSLVSFGGGGNGYVIPQEGRPVYGIYSFPWAGLDPATGDPQGYIDGIVSKDYYQLATPNDISDIQYNGPARPLYYGSVGNTFSFKNFSLFINLSFKLDYYFRRFSVNYFTLFNFYAANKDYSLRWQQPGDEQHTQVPSAVYPANNARDIFYNRSAVLIDKGDHIRIQDMSLSYDLNKNVWRRLPLNHIRLYTHINNVGLLWKANKDGLDPDYPLGIPAITTFAFGVRAEL